jgi:hypothetical protein
MWVIFRLAKNLAVLKVVVYTFSTRKHNGVLTLKIAIASQAKKKYKYNKTKSKALNCKT